MDVILCDIYGNPVGKLEKLKAHKEGKLHQAFSIFIFNSKKELLLQKRSKEKYHSKLKWSNTCCSHPLTQDILNEAKLRLRKEMGIDADIKRIFSFQYKAKVEDLIENEFDYVFIGRYDKDPKPDKSEVDDFRWVSISDLIAQIKATPDKFTPWLRLCIDEVSKFV